MAGKIRLLGLLASLQAGRADTGEISTELRNRRQAQAEGSFDDRKVVCYYANWAVYRKGDAQFTPQNINPYLCTHLIYAFGGLGKDDTIVPFDEYQDIEKGGYGRFAALKTYNKDLKTMLAIGGWNEGSRRFSPMVEDPARRQVFIKSALRFLRQYNFDGIDLDWEYPTLRAGGRPQDKENYATFIEEMRQAFESEAENTRRERMLISMAVPASLEYAGQGYAIDRLNEALDFFNLLTYDYHSAHEPAVNHHSPLYRPDEWSDYDFRKDLNIDSTVQFYLAHGASRHKLVLGIPTYGRSYTLANPDAHEISSPTVGPGEKGEGTKEDGYLAYYEICQKVLDDGWDLVTQYPGIMGPYAHKDNQWVGFDDVDIAVEKAFYVAEEELGGIMFWTIDNDDFRGLCSKTPYPLIESAKEAMYSVESTVKTKTSVEVSTSEQVRRTRLRLTEKELANLSPSTNGSAPRKTGVVRPPPPQPSRQAPRKLGGTTTTPAPPTTPSSGPAFKCRAEGFYPHATSCKKYFWCLDTPSQGMVAHTFSCPQGLYFNEHTDGCDFLRNVNCGDKDTTEVQKVEGTEKEASSTGASPGDSDEEESEEEDPKSLKDILELVKAAGGVEGLEKQIEEEAVAKKEEENRRERISAKTRSRLTQLLKGRQRESGLVRTSAQDNLEKLARKSSSPEATSPPAIQTPKPFRSRNLARKTSFFRNRNTNKATTNRRVTQAPATKPTRSRSSINLFRNRFRQTPLSRTTPAPTTPTPSTEEPLTTLDPEANQRVQIVGAHLEPEVPEEEPLHLGVFKPKAGSREKLRSTLHEVLLEELASRPEGSGPEEQSTLSPLSTVTISKNTRIQGESIGRARETVRGFASRRREQSSGRREQAATTERAQDSNRYVTIQRGRASTAGPPVGQEGKELPAAGAAEYTESQDFRPTVPDVSVPTEPPAPPPTTPPPPPPVVLTTRGPPPPREQPRRLDIFNVKDEEELQGAALPGGLDQEAEDADSSSHDSQSITQSLFERRRPDPAPRPARPFVGRPLRPVRPEAPRGRAPATPARAPAAPRGPVSQPRAPVSQARAPTTPKNEVAAFEYEYYYDYLDTDTTDTSRQNTDYDLVPLANKVRILSDGMPHCLDVGVFPHPFSCKKFINCFRNPGTGIQGSIYQCPSYLAFDPVGGRCNWVNEIVCAAGSSRS